MAKKKKKRTFLKIFIFLFLLFALVVGSFVLGIYYGLIDTQEFNEKYALYEYPIIGQYFVKPEKTEEKTEPQGETKPETEEKDKDKEQEKEKEKEKPPEPKKVVLTKEELAKQTAEREAAEKKRVSKLARLYGQMKPQEAADAMQNLDNDLTVAILQRMDESQAAKVLAKFDAAK
ncbi:MAG: magnesium transporter MgtE, partial [Selenomonadaceae bacterium]|nr:magnesium transporter MgtE [Selenomonadaceae bacterium]